MIWIKEKPFKDGEWYWWKPLGGNDSEAIPIKVDKKSEEYKKLTGQFSHRPIPLPTDKPEHK